MSIADKLTTIAENEQKVYDAGYEAGKAEGGGSADYLRLAKAVQFNSLNDFDKEEVELHLDSCLELLSLFYATSDVNKNITVKHLTISNATPISMYNAFGCGWNGRDETLKRITLNFDTSTVTNFRQIFHCLMALEIIDGNPLNLSSVNPTISYATHQMFHYCSALIEVRFVANSIPAKMDFSMAIKLSAESIQSIIDGLADLTGSTAQTLTVHATVGAKITDEQKASISAKNWTLVY